MTDITRREFTKAGLLLLGSAPLAGAVSTASASAAPEALTVADLGRLDLPTALAELMRTADRTAGREAHLLLSRPHKEELLIGELQRVSEVFDLEHVENVGLPVTRRHGGGGPTYHDEGQLTYTMVLPAASVEETVPRLALAVAAALQHLGVPARAGIRNDVLVNGKKVAGITAFRTANGAILGGTLLLDTDLSEMNRAISSVVPKHAARRRLRAGQRVVLADFSKAVPSLPRVRNVNARRTGPHVTHQTFAEVLPTTVAEAFAIPAIRQGVPQRGPLADPTTLEVKDPEEAYERIARLEDWRQGVGLVVAPSGLLQATIGLTRDRRRIEEVMFTGDIIIDDASSLREVANRLKGVPVADAAKLAARHARRLGVVIRLGHPQLLSDAIKTALADSLFSKKLRAYDE